MDRARRGQQHTHERLATRGRHRAAAAARVALVACGVVAAASDLQLARADEGETAAATASRPSGDISAVESGTRPGATDRGGTPRISGFTWPRRDAGGTRSTGSDGWWSGMAFVALMLVCGGAAVVARRLGPRASSSAVQVVGRVSLSPKHSVYLLRVGRRQFLVGAGPQGPPALISELDEVSQLSPEAERGDKS
jgi:Flagellar biosynthesis protein, FliO